MKKTNKAFSVILIVLGTALIISAGVMAVVSYISAKNAGERAPIIVEKLYDSMPEVRDKLPEEMSNTQMPVVELDGSDFAGVLTVPAYDSELPLGSPWGSVSKYPRVYTGSVYDGSLIIGGSDDDEQMGYIDVITNGDEVTVTDVQGNRYSYSVYEIERTKDVTTDNLVDEESDLVLFARNTYAFDYTVVRCKYK